MFKYRNNVLLPRMWNRKPVRKRTDIRNRKWNAAMCDLYHSSVDRRLVETDAAQRARLEFTHILTLTPTNQVDVPSFHYLLERFVREVGRAQGKGKDGSITNWMRDYERVTRAGGIPFYACIEFGEKKGGIHAHAMIHSVLTDDELQKCWSLAIGDDSNPTERAVVLSLSDTTTKTKAVQYCISMEHQYADIDAKHSTTYAGDLVIYRYNQRWFNHENDRRGHDYKGAIDDTAAS